MKLYLLALLLPSAAFAAPTIRLEPGVVTSCREGLGIARVVWEGADAGPVALRAGDAVLITSESASGYSDTGFWISDGLVFTLTDADGRVLASTRAILRCGPPRSWWPLQVGNEWHFRASTRVSTGNHDVFRVARTESINGVDWAVIVPGTSPSYSRLREDARGRLLRLAPDGTEEVLFDEAGGSASWRIFGGQKNVSTEVGVVAEVLDWQGMVLGLSRESGRLALGIGPLYLESYIMAGSSGGFGSGQTLIEARIAGLRYTPSYPRIELMVENAVADVTGGKVRNCAVPCYFVACSLVPGTDPPGTFKPCMEASIRGGEGVIELVNAQGTTLFSGKTSAWLRIPLYDGPAFAAPGAIVPFPPGQYVVRGTVGSSVMTAPLTIR